VKPKRKVIWMPLCSRNKNRGFKDRGSVCRLCARVVSYITRHHLVPKKYKKQLLNNKIYTCTDCAKMLHALFTLKELRDKYNTADKIREHTEFKKYLEWVKNKPEGIVKHPKRNWKGGKYE